MLDVFKGAEQTEAAPDETLNNKQTLRVAVGSPVCTRITDYEEK